MVVVMLATLALAVAPPDEGTVTVKGTVKWEGRIPRVRKINSQMEADPKCAAMHPDPVYSDILVVDRESRGVRWAFVYVKSGLKGGDFKAPAKPVVLDQKGCMYHPHVAGVMEGQDILIRNSDGVVHNIHALPLANRGFNIAQPLKGMEMKKAFTRKEVMVKVKCDIHSWMGAWIGVLDHPFFAVTKADGTFEIKGLPPGKYTIAAWHEVTGEVSREVEVEADAVVDFAVQPPGRKKE